MGLSFFAILLSPLHFAIADSVSLTEQERRWLEAHLLVIAGGSPDWTLFNFADKEGHHQGVSHDYLELISEKTGLKFKIIIDQWHNNLEKIRQHKIDVLPAVYYTPERSQFLIFSSPYFEALDYFFIRQDVPAKNFSDLNGLRLAIPEGYAHIQLLKKHFPKINLILVDTLGEAIDAVLERRADLLYDSYGTLMYILQQESISSIVPFKSTRNIIGANPVHMVIRKDWPILASIIDKGLDTITPAEKRSIYEKWLPKPQEKMSLSDAEKQWLQQHRNIHFAAFKNKLPYENIDANGKLQGIAADFLALIQQRLGGVHRLVAGQQQHRIECPVIKKNRYGGEKHRQQRAIRVVIQQSIRQQPCCHCHAGGASLCGRFIRYSGSIYHLVGKFLQSR